MCIKVNADDFITIHHELGHNYYQRAYNKQPFLYLNGANDGFHEAIGDFVALSITPQYLVDIGLLDKAKVPSADKDIGLLLRQAMDKQSEESRVGKESVSTCESLGWPGHEKTQ